ncbi:hypothetical protein [Halocatena pleomorpha]|uniref:Uncharacterized protein n=1 Tax=Halocatena pleomorpha TaxID=1785090 RepID=A0A3P3R4B3_9EURY|nr:hypothetical protein [Halocatena pleomorpha]RRJ28326.1 hypothetical protein EIK79_15895 [Halocatena pleomorpha]
MTPPPGPTDGQTDERISTLDDDRSHVLIESGCLREFAAHILNRSEDAVSNAEIDVRQTAFEPLETAEIVQQLPNYDQLAAVVEARNGCRLTVPRCTLTAVVDVAERTWELLAFEIAYPQTSTVYSILGRRIDRAVDSVATIIDPTPNATRADTAVLYDITTDQLDPIPISLEAPLLPSDRCSEQHTTDVGYHVAIDWFLS